MCRVLTEVFSAAFNLAIVAGYFFAALYVGPKIKGTSLWTKVTGAGFFLTCGLHHGEGAYHVLVDPELGVSEMLTSAHMLAIDGPQAFFIWSFILGIYYDLVVKPRKAYTGDDA